MIAPDQIVVATDFSPASTAALRMASRVARLFQAKVSIVHVFQYSPHHRYPVPVDWMVEMIRQDMRVKLDESRLLLTEMNIQTEALMIERGLPAEEILDLSRSCKNPLLVVGTHAVGGMDRFLLGSTAEAIFRQAHCPVMTVGPHVVYKTGDEPQFHKVLYPTDCSAASLVAIPLAMLLRQSSTTSLRVLHVIDPDATTNLSPKDLYEPVRKSFEANAVAKEDAGVEYVSLHGKDIGQAVVNEAERFAADVVILGVRRASAFASHLPPKIAYQIIAAAPCAVLTVSS